jgi:hypothetical protein
MEASKMPYIDPGQSKRLWLYRTRGEFCDVQIGPPVTIQNGTPDTIIVNEVIVDGSKFVAVELPQHVPTGAW